MTTTTRRPTAPERSQEQRMAALLLANDVRIKRSRLKEDIAEARRSVLELLEHPLDEIMTMKVSDLLMSVPHVGAVKVRKWLAMTQISTTKTVGGISPRQRRDLAVHIRAFQARCAAREAKLASA